MTHRYASFGQILLGLLGGLCLTAAAWAQTVTLTSPTNNQSFTAPASITLQATTSGSGIRKVEFYQGSTLIGSDSSSPYRITWSNVAAGSYSLTAKAKNKSGSVLATSTAVAIVVNGTVTISLTSPTNNQLFAAPATVTAVATTTGSGVAAVDFYGDGSLLGTATTSPYSFTQGNIPAGSHVVTAQARNSNGTVLATSAPVTILVDAPPTVSLTSPAPNQVLTAPATLTLAATATDSDGSVSRVDFYQGTTLIGTTTTSPYTATWNGVAPGTYTLSARATDNLGLVTPSAPVSLTVTAAGPATGMYFIHPDHLNTPRVVTDTNNTVVWRWDNNEPFGNTPANADPNATGTPFAFNLRFPGQYFDGESNTHYNYFRDYDPGTGRYTTADPIGLAGGSMSLYTYADSAPTMKTDPLGLQVLPIPLPLPLPGFPNGKPPAGPTGSPLDYFLPPGGGGGGGSGSGSGSGSGNCEPDPCPEERAQCTELCNRARRDPDMRNIWGGSFGTCMRGCMPRRCGGN